MLTCLDSGWLRESQTGALLWANLCSERGRDEFLVPALQRAAKMLREGQTVLVHCMRGRHRTGAFVAALKVRVTYYKPYRLRYYRFVVC